MKNIYFKYPCTDNPNCTRQGFSLVEVSLALMVVGIGMLAVVSMFVSGVDQKKRSFDDTQSAFFADEVFNGLLAASEGDEDKIPPDEISWSSIGESVTNLTIAMGSKDADTLWADPVILDVIIDNNIHTNIYKLKENANLVNHAIRYSLSVQRKDRCVKAVTLCTYPGQYGSTNNPNIFYMTIFNYKLQNP